MDPNSLAWFLTLVLHGAGAGCCIGQAQIALPSVECKVAAGKDTCIVSPYEICKAIGADNKDAAFPLDCIAKPK